MPNQRSVENAQTSISLPKLLLSFARKKSEECGLDVSTYVRLLIRQDKIDNGYNLTLGDNIKTKK